MDEAACLTRRTPTRPIAIHAPREGSDLPAGRQAAAVTISIHAPREGSDFRLGRVHLILTLISIHAPREGSDSKSS